MCIRDSLFPRPTYERLSKLPPGDKPRLNASCNAPPLPPHNSNMSTLLCRPDQNAGIMEKTSA
eukprot:8819210-Pyramimonas_sp.AAC.1